MKKCDGGCYGKKIEPINTQEQKEFENRMNIRIFCAQLLDKNIKKECELNNAKLMNANNLLNQKWYCFNPNWKVVMHVI